MAAPITARFGKFRVLLGTPDPLNPPPYPINAINKSVAGGPVRITLQTGISSFKVGMVTAIAGITDADYAHLNGQQTVLAVGTGGAQWFDIDNDTSTATGAYAGTGATADAPPVMHWAAPCGFTTKSFILTKNLQEVNIPDCDDPDAVAWIGRDAQSLTAQITGEGIAAAESVPTWNDAWQDELSVPGRVEIEFSTGMLIYEGYFQVETLTFGAEQGGRVTLNVSMQSDGIVVDTWTPAP